MWWKGSRGWRTGGGQGLQAVMAEAAMEQAAQAAKLQFTVVSTADLERLKAPARNAKE